MISCAEAVDQLWAYIGAELSSADRARIDRHLAFCRRCCGELEFADELRRFLRDASKSELPGEVGSRLDLFLQGLEPEGAP